MPQVDYLPPGSESNSPDSSLVALSRSSSDESLLPYDDLNHARPLSENAASDGDGIHSEERCDATASDSAFSDVSSKPPQDTPIRKSITTTPNVTSTTTTTSRRKVAEKPSTRLSLSSSRLPSKIPPVPKLIPAAQRPITVKSTPAPKTGISRERPKIEKRASLSATKPVRTPSSVLSTTPRVRNSLPLRKGLNAPNTPTVPGQKPTQSHTMNLKESDGQKVLQPGPRTPRTRERESSGTSGTSSCLEGPPPDVIQELVQYVAELKGKLVELQGALEDSNRVELEKDQEIALLRSQVQSSKSGRCPCGRGLESDVHGEEDERKVNGDFVAERINESKKLTNTAVQTESPRRREPSFSGEETDKLGQLVSFRIGGRRNSSQSLQHP